MSDADDVPYRVVISLSDGRRLVRTFDSRAKAFGALTSRFDLSAARKLGRMTIEDEAGGSKVRVVLNPDCIVSMVAEPVPTDGIDGGVLQ